MDCIELCRQKFAKCGPALHRGQQSGSRAALSPRGSVRWASSCRFETLFYSIRGGFPSTRRACGFSQRSPPAANISVAAPRNSRVSRAEDLLKPGVEVRGALKKRYRAECAEACGALAIEIGRASCR